MTRLCLIRHGQTEWNEAGRWQGQALNAPGLTEKGFAQANAVPFQIKGTRIAAIYSSDLLRCTQTAEPIAKFFRLPIILEHRLREINLGEWEGMLTEEIREKYPKEMAERMSDPLNARAPGGESPLDVETRVLAVLGEIAKEFPNESVAIVAHGLSLAIILCRARSIPLDKVYDHIPDNATPEFCDWN